MKSIDFKIQLINLKVWGTCLAAIMQYRDRYMAISNSRPEHVVNETWHFRQTESEPRIGGEAVP